MRSYVNWLVQCYLIVVIKYCPVLVCKVYKLAGMRLSLNLTDKNNIK